MKSLNKVIRQLILNKYEDFFKNVDLPVDFGEQRNNVKIKGKIFI